MARGEPCFKNEGDDEEWHVYGKDASRCGKVEPVYAPGGGTRWAMLETKPEPMCEECISGD